MLSSQSAHLAEDRSPETTHPRRSNVSGHTGRSSSCRNMSWRPECYVGEVLASVASTSNARYLPSPALGTRQTESATYRQPGRESLPHAALLASAAKGCRWNRQSPPPRTRPSRRQVGLERTCGLAPARPAVALPPHRSSAEG